MNAPLKKALQTYLSAGWALCHVTRGSKGPRTKGWNLRENAITNMDQATRQIRDGVGVLHAYCDPPLVCLDIDDLTTARAWWNVKQFDLDALLASTTGPDSGKSNRAKALFRAPPNYPFRTINIGHTEFRQGTAAGLSVQDVLPPTIHPSTEAPYTWRNGGPDEIADMPHELIALWDDLAKSYEHSRHSPREQELTPELEWLVTSCLEAVPVDCSYEDWLSIGMSLHATADELLLVWEEWSAGHPTYTPGECEARWAGFDRERGIGPGTFWALVRKHDVSPEGIIAASLSQEGRPPEARAEWCVNAIAALGPHALKMLLAPIYTAISKLMGTRPADIRATVKDSQPKKNIMTHHEIAHEQIRIFNAATNTAEPVVVCAGCLWEPRNGAPVWSKVSHKRVQNIIGATFPDQPKCTRGNDYIAIQKILFNEIEDDHFFTQAPLGLAAGEHFYRLGEDGSITIEALRPVHRQRFYLSTEPDPDFPTPVFDEFITTSLVEDADIEVLQETLGAVLFRLSDRTKRAILLYGPTDSGKSTLSHVIQGLVFPEYRSYVNISDLGDERRLATMAGTALNVVGEIHSDRDAESNIFKQLTGGDIVQARNMYQDPFSFRYNGTILCLGNFFPSMRGGSDQAFFNRFQIISMPHTIPTDKMDRFLIEKVRAEQAGILAWAMEGAQRLAANNFVYTHSAAHENLMSMWKSRSNSVRAWVNMDERVSYGEDVSSFTTNSQIYTSYKAWANHHGSKPVGLHRFLDELRLLAGLKESTDPRGFKGIAINNPGEIV